MILERKAPAKVNLGLHVLRKRPDGYHDIETVMVRVGWFDRLRVRAASDFAFTCSDPALPTDGSNLCVQAVQQLHTYCGRAIPVTLHLDKYIPYGAGLGGGSSDAANTLVLINEFLNLGLDTHTLQELAAALGSDVPFFVEGVAAFATGRGEQLDLFARDAPYQLPFELVIVVPPVHVSTADAYRGITPDDRDRPDVKALVYSNDLSRWRAQLINDFETTVFSKYPLIGEIKRVFYSLGAGYASMSGSGSAVFGVFERKEAAHRATRYFRQHAGTRVWHTKMV